MIKSVVKSTKHVLICVSLRRKHVLISVVISTNHMRKNVLVVWKELVYSNLQNRKIKETESLLF